MDNEIPTPLTDSQPTHTIKFVGDLPHETVVYVPRHFARELERSLTKAQERIGELDGDLKELIQLLRSNIRYNDQDERYEWVIKGELNNLSQDVESAIRSALNPSAPQPAK